MDVEIFGKVETIGDAWLLGNCKAMGDCMTFGNGKDEVKPNKTHKDCKTNRIHFQSFGLKCKYNPKS